MGYDYELLLAKMLQDAGIEDQPTFRPGEVQRLLGISESSFYRYCDAWEPPSIAARDHRGLESFMVGTHRRVPRHALVDWLARNNSYTRKLA